MLGREFGAPGPSCVLFPARVEFPLTIFALLAMEAHRSFGKINGGLYETCGFAMTEL